MLPDDHSLETFIPAWVSAAGDAAGQAARLQADLEPMESQSALIKLLADASTGISKSRKDLTMLGAAADAASVQGILNQVGWLRVFVMSCPGQAVRGSLQEAGEDCRAIAPWIDRIYIYIIAKEFALQAIHFS